MIADPQQYLQRLMLLIHHSPLAMAETDAKGTLRQLNPKAIQLMMPMATHLGLPGDNLLDILVGYLPVVGQAVNSFEPDSGLLISQEPYKIKFSIGQTQIERYFCLTVEKIAADSLLIFFNDVTDFLMKSDSVRQRL